MNIQRIATTDCTKPDLPLTSPLVTSAIYTARDIQPSRVRQNISHKATHYSSLLLVGILPPDSFRTISMSRPLFLSLPTELHHRIFSDIPHACSLYWLSRTCKYFSILAAPLLCQFALYDENAYALHWAGSVNNTALLQRLIDAGVEVLQGGDCIQREKFRGYSYTSYSDIKYTALDYAVIEGNLEATKFFLKHGAYDLIAWGTSDAFSRFLLHFPARRGDIPLLQLLLDYNRWGTKPPKYLSVDDINFPQHNWKCAVVVAIKCSQVETVNIFLDRGIVELAVDYHQLHCTAGSGQTEVGRLLLKRGLDHHTEKLYGRDRWPWLQTWSDTGDT